MPATAQDERSRRALLVQLTFGLLMVFGLLTCRGGGSDAPGPDSDSPPAVDEVAAGWAEADPELASLCRRFTESDHPYWGQQQIAQYEAQLKSLENETTEIALRKKVRLQAVLGGELMRIGKFESAAEQLRSARELMERANTERDWVRRIVWQSLLAHLRLGIGRNCADRANRSSCALPLDGVGTYEDPAETRTAIELIGRFLELDPDPRFVLAAKWLLNVAHALVGTYPDGVDQDSRIPLERFAAPYAMKRMLDVAPDLGIDAYDLAGGSVVEDLDNDGFLDLVASTMDFCDIVKYYRNNGDGTFSDLSVASGLAWQPGSLTLNQTDYDNDGWIDLFLTRGAWLFVDGQLRNSLMKNNGDGTFTDVTHAAGLAEPRYPTQAAAWGDYDNDGDLDLYLGNEEALGQAPYPGQLYRNNGDGTFTDVAREAGVENGRMSKGVAWGDYDNDLDLDLYVSNFGSNRLYANQGDGTFVDVAPQLGVEKSVGLSFATWFWDYDNDGWLDIYVGHTVKDVYKVAEEYADRAVEDNRLRLYRNLQGKRFEDVTERVGLHHVQMPMGANYGDVDNDGYLDIYLGTGAPGFEVLVTNALYHNGKGQAFHDVTLSTGLGHLGKGHGVAFGDIDNDGDQDIYHQVGGMYPGDRSHNALFENPGYGHHWLTVKVVGVKSNRAGIGVRLKLVIDEDDREREVHATVGSGGSFGASSLQQEIGIGRARGVRRLEVLWPSSGIRQVFHDIEADRFIEITEGDDTVRMLERRPIEFARKR